MTDLGTCDLVVPNFDHRCLHLWSQSCINWTPTPTPSPTPEDVLPTPTEAERRMMARIDLLKEALRAADFVIVASGAAPRTGSRRCHVPYPGELELIDAILMVAAVREEQTKRVVDAGR